MAEHGVLAQLQLDGRVGVCGGLCDDIGGREECEGEGMEDTGESVGIGGCRGVDCYGACGEWEEDVICGVYEGADLVSQAYLYDHDSRFFVGWELGKSWILCTVSWAVLAVDVFGVVGAAVLLPKEDDYEPIPEPRES